MARLRRSKLLTCFYCGKRSSIPNDGSHKDFLCLYCDATNYIDENGEITDPPVATDRELPAPRYVKNQPSSPTNSSRSDNIFCDTCLKNQRLFTASLAQYLPDDPSDPINEPLDRKYYKFRRDLEERYPQVCADCEGRVQGRLQAAGYTAQTDHLRRLMANSRARKPRKRLTPLDLAERVGRFVWWSGLILQVLWHLKSVSNVMELSSEALGGMVDPDASSRSELVTQLVEISRRLPSADFLIRGSITAAVLSIWWNPRFVQVTRGFSRHLLGFRQWYCFQGLIIFFRVVFRRVGELAPEDRGKPASHIMPHLLMAGLMLMITIIARKSIRVDNQALFRVPQSQLSPSRTRASASSPTVSPQARSLPQTDFVAPARSHQIESSRVQPPTQMRTDLRPLPGPQPPPVPFGLSTTSQPNTPFRSSFAAAEPSSPIPNDPEEMDWTPTQSQHRAFSNVPAMGTPSRPFSQAPVQEKSGPFWYKVPPAPVNPAHKLRNPPRVPIVRHANVEPKSQGLSFMSSGSPQQTNGQARSSGVEFQAPTFFAPTKDDERNSLADMLNKSFSLGSEVEDTETKVHSGLTTVDSQGRQTTAVRPQMPILTGILLLLWTMTTVFTDQLVLRYVKETQLVAVAVAGGVALVRLGQSPEPKTGDHHGFAGVWSLLLPVLEVLELAMLCYIGWETWVDSADITGVGLCVLLFGFVKSIVVAVRGG
ncbi:hypothetical protein CC79DRAFT_837931 [Sarocladium strictum]